MFSLKSRAKKIIGGLIATVIISPFIIKPVLAQDSGNIETWLALIWMNTNSILADIDGVPAFIKNWIDPDTSSTTATIQNYFSSASSAYQQEYIANAQLQNKLMKDFFGSATTDSFPNANDLNYQTLLGGLYWNPDPRKDNSIDPAYNYTRYAGGLNITHLYPSSDWRGKPDAIARYTNYYNTVSAIQTFNAWVLGQDYSSMKLGFPFATQQWNLIMQASNSNWFQQVASESIGTVLRQILMYDSQIFVALTQQLRLQQEQLTAQSMTNTLLVLSNQSTENYMVKEALGQVRS